MDRRGRKGSSMRCWAVLLAIALTAWLFVLSGASAQSTGSSAGGSSWGSSSSGGGGSSSGWSGGGSHATAAVNSYEPPLWGQILGAAAFLVFLYFFFRGLGRLAAGPGVSVSVVQVAIDARARRFVQEELKKMVAESNTTSKAGLSKLLAAAAGALTASKLAWIYAGSRRYDGLPLAQARATHTRDANDVRSRFQTELVRKADGNTRTADAPDLTAREHEGEGVVVVSLVVATHAKPPRAAKEPVAEIEQLLAMFSALPADALAALEVIWSPAAENDRMSTDELEARYPELTRLTAVGGRVFCAYCAGPHAAELAKCPHCGAPTESSRVASTPG